MLNVPHKQQHKSSTEVYRTDDLTYIYDLQPQPPCNGHMPFKSKHKHLQEVPLFADSPECKNILNNDSGEVDLRSSLLGLK